MRAADWEEMERISNRASANLKKNDYQHTVDLFDGWAKDNLKLGSLLGGFSADPYFKQVFITWCILASIPVYHWSVLLEIAMDRWAIKEEK